MLLFVVIFTASSLLATPTEQESISIFNAKESHCETDQLFTKQFLPQLTKLQPAINRIVDHVVHGHPGETYRAVTSFVDFFGPRLTGTPNLERSIDHMLTLLRKEGHNNVHGENVTVPDWVCVALCSCILI